VVEDDADMQILERTMLEFEGYQVSTAGNGRDALRLCELNPPDLIVLDLKMPVMDGLSFLEELQASRKCLTVPVLCVSASGQQMASRALRRGARECLAKPVDFVQLCSRVKAHLLC
jgi:DNA-binding response OmpR family regulator